MRAPPPVLGHTVNSYRRSVLVKAKKAFIPKSHELRQFSLNDVKADALGPIEKQILDAAVVEARNPNNVPQGELRMRPDIDPHTGHKVNKFYGRQCFVVLPNHGTNFPFAGGFRPGRRVTGFYRAVERI
jgi:hypothetical protein